SYRRAQRCPVRHQGRPSPARRRQMKPAAFEYVRAASLEEALAALAKRQGEARALAGGQTLGPMLNLRLATPSCLVDIGQIAALKSVEKRGASRVIGA